MEAVLHKGNIKIHHFKHKPPVTCSWGRGETQQHYSAKLAIFDALKGEASVKLVELEKDFGVSVADVYALINGVSVALEIQRSNLSVADITLRTRNYYSLGIYVLWVALPTEDLWDERYSPSAWEKWCHSAYYGRVFYWDEGLWFHAVHFSSYVTYVEQSTWYSSDGEEQSAGGYDRVSRRYKTPVHGRRVHLCRDFLREERSPWAGGSVDIPRCRLFHTRRQRKWWE